MIKQELNSYKFNFDIWKLTLSNFKQKESEIFRNIIKETRLGKILSFSNYGICDFEDDCHIHPIVDELDKFSRSNTNMLIFNISKNDFTGDEYNKLFIYQNLGKIYESYGYVFYNTETKKQIHKYCIEYTLDNLLYSIYNTFYNYKINKKLSETINKDKFLKIKNKNNNSEKKVFDINC